MSSNLSVFYDDLSRDMEIQDLIARLSKEWLNRNTEPYAGISMYSGKVIKGDEATENYARLIEIINKRIKGIDFSDTSTLLGNNKYLGFLMGIVDSDKDGELNQSYLVLRIIVALLEDHKPGIDEYVESLDDVTLLEELNLEYDKNKLVTLTPEMELRPWAVILKDGVMIYPHQFLRRFYSANFVNTPAILNHFRDKKIQIKLRIDPHRRSIPRYYRQIMEMDYWHGEHFTADLLMSKSGATWTKHATSDYRGTKDKPLCPSYPVRFTVFRSKMMDANLRELMIEEYTPVVNPFDTQIPLRNTDTKYTIQKFGHLVYDQQKQAFVHFDTAVRVFDPSEYNTVYETLEAGKDPGDKLGDRHKLYLIEGEFDINMVEPLLYDFFMYNPHIEEYFFTKY